MKKEILNNLIKGYIAANFNNMIEYINNNDCVYDLDLIDMLINDVLNISQSKKLDLDLFYEYQLLINSMILSKNFLNIYNPNAKVVSLLEMVRILGLIFNQDVEQYLEPSNEVVVGIVEVNKKGLKIKHFAYVSEYKVGEIVFVGKLHPANFAKVTDFYLTPLKSIYPYIVHISTEYVNKFDTSIKNIVSNHLQEIKDVRNVKVIVDGIEGIYQSKIENYFLQQVEVIKNGETRFGHIINDVYNKEVIISGEVIRSIESNKRIYNKERRIITDEIVDHIYKGWTIDKLKQNLDNMDRIKYINIFATFEKLQDLIENNPKSRLNEIEELNLYYRPFINFIIKNVDLNKFYFQNNGLSFSILYYLSILKGMENTALDFIIDEKYSYMINIVIINVYGHLKKCFAYDKGYLVGEPVLIPHEQEYIIGFVHELNEIPLYELIESIDYYQSIVILQILQLENLVDNRSEFKDKIVLVKIYDGSETHIVIARNYVPFVGQSVEFRGKQAIVVAEATAVEAEKIDTNNYESLD